MKKTNKQAVSTKDVETLQKNQEWCSMFLNFVIFGDVFDNG